MITSEFSYANLYRAYLDCRKNKRNTDDALAFEINAEENLHDLWVALNKGSYHPSASDCFVANSPKLREIIAADFKDRIIHHLLVSHLEKIFEPVFIYNSFASRKGKGIHLAVNRLRSCTRKITANGSRQAFYLQLDIRNFFMEVDKNILFNLIQKKCHSPAILWLSQVVIFNDPTENVRLKSSLGQLANIPRHKSLFEVNRGQTTVFFLL